MGHARKPKLRRPSKVNLAWAAGLIDGEGCISITKCRPRGENINILYSLTIGVNMVDRPTIYRLKHLFGGGKISKKKPTRTENGTMRRTFYTWAISSKQAKQALEWLLPYSITKKSQMSLGIRFQNRMSPTNQTLTDAELAVRERFYRRMRLIKTREWK